jgi:hypothetical protein
MPLPLAVVGALRERSFLDPRADDDLAVAEALLATLNTAWRAGVRAEDAAVDVAAEQRRAFLISWLRSTPTADRR